MIVAAAGVFALALVATVYLLLRHHAAAQAALVAQWAGERAGLLDHHAEAQAQWAVERRELLNRIQRPELIPVAAPEHFEIPDPEPDESNLIGTIAYPDSEDS